MIVTAFAPSCQQVETESPTARKINSSFFFSIYSAFWKQLMFYPLMLLNVLTRVGGYMVLCCFIVLFWGFFHQQWNSFLCFVFVLFFKVIVTGRVPVD